MAGQGECKKPGQAMQLQLHLRTDVRGKRVGKWSTAAHRNSACAPQLIVSSLSERAQSFKDAELA